MGLNPYLVKYAYDRCKEADGITPATPPPGEGKLSQLKPFKPTMPDQPASQPQKPSKPLLGSTTELLGTACPQS
jgi:hypothetical protein